MILSSHLYWFNTPGGVEPLGGFNRFAQSAGPGVDGSRSGVMGCGAESPTLGSTRVLLATATFTHEAQVGTELQLPAEPVGGLARWVWLLSESRE